MDLNADVGESVERWRDGSDKRLLDLLTSANVCCGAYAGDADLIAETCAHAAASGVAIGAQVGYVDREGFGRRRIDVDAATLRAQIREQIEFLQSLAAPAPVVYVKPHGALYNRIVDDDEHARAVVDALDGLPLLGLPGSRSLALAADRHIRVYREGFADRRYTPAGTLTPRDQPGAVLDDADEVAAQAVELLDLDVDSICVHSDTPGAEHLVRRVRQALLEAGAQLEAFG